MSNAANVENVANVSNVANARNKFEFRTSCRAILIVWEGREVCGGNKHSVNEETHSKQIEIITKREVENNKRKLTRLEKH